MAAGRGDSSVHRTSARIRSAQNSSLALNPSHKGIVTFRDNGRIELDWDAAEVTGNGKCPGFYEFGSSRLSTFLTF